MTIGMTSSLQGMQRAETQLNQVAQSIAQGPVGDTVDLSTEAVAMIQAKNSFEANTAALKVSDEMTQTLLKSL